jgi:MATE family multidrug resistance protein
VRLTEYFPVYRKNLNLAFPVILAQMGQVTVNLADNMMVGHVGTAQLAAASFANSLFIVGMLFGMGITFSLTPLVGQAFGSNQSPAIGSWFRNGVLVFFIASLLISGLMSPVVLFMRSMGQSREVVSLAIPYYLIQVSSLIPMMLFFSVKQLFEGIGNTRIAMVITVFSNVLNIILNYILIYGKLGFPACGLNGAGYATLISRLVMPVIFVLAVIRNPRFTKYFQGARHAHFELQKIKRILSIGLPIGLQMVIEVLAFSAGAIMMGWISAESQAGHQIALSMASMTYMISFGLAAGTTIRVSHAAGEANREELKKTIFASLHLVVLFMSSMGLLFIILRHFIPELFTSDPAVVRVAAGLLVIGALFQIFDGVQVVLLGSLRGLADVRFPMYFAFVSYIMLSLPVSYLCAFVFHFGPQGVWLGFVFGLASAAVFFAFRLRHQIRHFRA